MLQNIPEVEFNHSEDRPQNAEDRRRNYRIEIEEPAPPVRAELTLQNGQVLPVEIINYSFAGLLFYTEAESGLQVDDFIPQIRLIYAHKKPVNFSGKIVRIEKGADKTFCGVRFGEGTPEKPGKVARPKFKSAELSITPAIRSKWLNKLRSISNYTKIENIDHQILAEEAAYAAFDQITASLSIEERWWFFEMLDELKRKEPYYPPRLLQEFIIVCEWGYSAIPSAPDWQRSGFSLLRFFSRWCGWIRQWVTAVFRAA